MCTEHIKIVYSQAIARVAASMGKGVSPTPCTWKHCSRCLRVFTFFFSTQQCNDVRITVGGTLIPSLMLPFPLHVSKVIMTAWNFENGNVHYYQQILKYREYAKIMATAVHANVVMGRHPMAAVPPHAHTQPHAHHAAALQTTQRYATETTSG